MGNALSAVEPYKLAVADCSQQAGGVLTTCNTTNSASQFPAFTPTAEVSAVSVTGSGVIQATLNSLGTTVPANTTITWKPTQGTTAITWNITTTATGNAAAAITKNSFGS
ncbi:pilin [Methylomonas sp. WSC-6]|uniref:Pilin n=1 Tax=Methylomonas rivi TaxID=2952226 RepID=A0ABT1U865_9GAMM|nr:pilin [Methylomonas sp. WSC-6]